MSRENERDDLQAGIDRLAKHLYPITNRIEASVNGDGKGSGRDWLRLTPHFDDDRNLHLEVHIGRGTESGPIADPVGHKWMESSPRTIEREMRDRVAAILRAMADSVEGN